MRIRIECEGAKNLPLESLIPTQDQLKELSQDNYAKLKNEILSEGFSFPFFVWQHNGENRILDGHHRRLVLIKMREEGYEIPDLPCAIVKANNEKEAARKLLAVTSQYAKITDQGLYEFMNKFDIEMSEIKDRFEFSDIDLDAFEDNFFTEVETLPEGEEDSVPEITHDPITKRGDVWLLGEHRLMCGDSTMIDDVEKLMNGEKIDLVHTDPPYGINETGQRQGRGNKGKKDSKIMAKGGDYKDFVDDSTDYAIDAFNLCEGIGIEKQVWWGANYYCHSLPQTNNWIVWDKRVEDKYKNTNGDAEMAFVKSKWNSIRMFRHLWMGLVKESEHGVARVHPTQKPIALAEWCIDYFEEKITSVMDLFLGSGTTLIACENKNISCYGMELSEHYCDVIINRWQNYTGKKAKLENGEYYNDLLDARQ